VDGYRTEEEQVEAIKKWWDENGKSIIAGVVIGIAAIFGWRGYNEHQVNQAMEASLLYEQMIVAARKNDAENSRVYAERIINEYESGTYAVFAKLMLAKLAAEQNDLEQAETQLLWVLNHNKQQEIEHIANLRLARVYIAADKLDKAQALLNTDKPGEFVARYEELRGDLLVKQGELEAAREAYQKALFNTVATEEAQSILEMKLDNLGRG
jgi:predicted negative regulator of RcsB-dependent stress response